jgi:hypothetical protein
VKGYRLNNVRKRCSFNADGIYHSRRPPHNQE